MPKYLNSKNPETELIRNALLLYPYILNQTISHGGAAEILGIRKSELIDIYDKLGYSYLDMTRDELDLELETFRHLKKGRAVSIYADSMQSLVYKDIQNSLAEIEKL